MTRKAWRVVWADGRAAVFFSTRRKAQAFRRDASQPVGPVRLLPVPKGWRVR
jgi:hypothetical protein